MSDRRNFLKALGAVIAVPAVLSQIKLPDDYNQRPVLPSERCSNLYVEGNVLYYRAPDGTRLVVSEP